MKKLLGFLAVGAFALGTSTASAAPVATTASLTLMITNVGSISIAGAGTVNVSGSTVTVGANLVVQGATPIVVAVTSTTAIQSLTAVGIANVSGTFVPGGGAAPGSPAEQCVGVTVGVACNAGGGVGGAMGLVGTINVRVNGFVNIPVNLSTANLGVGGAFVTPKTSISGDAGIWTTGTALVAVTTTITTPNGATVPSFTVAVPSNGAGSPLTLVTPTFVNAFGGLAFLPLFTSFTLDNVVIPEPGTLLLLASGVAGLLIVGRKNRS